MTGGAPQAGVSQAGSDVRLPLRLGVYTDMAYRRDALGVSSNRAFVRFVGELPPRVAEVVILGRLHPDPGRGHYLLPSGPVRFVALPFYERISMLPAMLAAMRTSLRRFDATLEQVDAVWIFGPHPMAMLFAWRARRRGTPLVLGVRQDYPRYIAGRLPGRGWQWALPAAEALDAAFRRLARRAPTVALGDELGRRYAGSGGPVLSTGFSLVPRSAVVELDEALARPWDGELRLLTVGRLDPEKNPLLLVDVLARLRAVDRRWRLTVAGDGPLRGELEAELARRGLRDSVELLGEVRNGPELWSLYGDAHAFVHVSLTEGLPQVLYEAQAAGTPIVATDVGGVGAALGHGATGLLVPPRDAAAVAGALLRLANEPELRCTLITAGLRSVATQTLEAQLDRVAEFIGEHVER